MVLVNENILTNWKLKCEIENKEYLMLYTCSAETLLFQFWVLNIQIRTQFNRNSLRDCIMRNYCFKLMPPTHRFNSWKRMQRQRHLDWMDRDIIQIKNKYMQMEPLRKRTKMNNKHWMKPAQIVFLKFQ